MGEFRWLRTKWARGNMYAIRSDGQCFYVTNHQDEKASREKLDSMLNDPPLADSWYPRENRFRSALVPLDTYKGASGWIEEHGGSED